MAALCSSYRHGKHLFRRCHLIKEVKRFILSENYYCKSEWQGRLLSPSLNKLNFNDLSLQMLEKYEKTNRSSLVDMDVLSNKMTEMSYANVDIVEDLIYKFHHSKDGFPVHDSIVHAIIRSYIELDLTHRLLPMMRKRRDYGILPDFFSANLLMDHFIKKQMFKEAADVAYEMTLQEDFRNKITFLLSLYSCTKYLYQIGDQSPAEEEQIEATEGEDEEEVDWVRVQIIHCPVYDDHFDITDERFLLGKSLYLLARELEAQDVLARSLQLVGLGLYNKFNKALDLLENWIESSDKEVVMETQLETFKNCLNWAPTRDPNEPEKDMGDRSIEDDMRKLRMTPDEKENCISRLQALEETLNNKSLISSGSLDSMIEEFVQREIHQYEQDDIKNQVACYKQWETQRVEMIQNQIREFERKTKQEEIEQLLLQLAEKEELLDSYKKKNQIHLSKLRMPREKVYTPLKKLDEDELEEKKKIKRSIIKKR